MSQKGIHSLISVRELILFVRSFFLSLRETHSSFPFFSFQSSIPFTLFHLFKIQVNGMELYGRCHLNASATIKSLPGPVFKIIILRFVHNLSHILSFHYYFLPSAFFFKNKLRIQLSNGRKINMTFSERFLPFQISYTAGIDDKKKTLLFSL